MEEIKLNAELRDSSGKGVARKLRAAGKIPAVIYGPETEASPMTVVSKELSALLRNHGSSNILIDLIVNGEDKPRRVIFRELQRDPVMGGLEHVDFYQVSMSKRITLTVTVELTGTPEGVKNGGITQQIIRDLDISCLPSDIPENVVLDVSEMEIGDSMHVDEISIDKVEILTNPTRTVVTIVPPTIVKTAEEEAAELAEGEEGIEGEEGVEGEEGAEAAPAEGEDKKE